MDRHVFISGYPTLLMLLLLNPVEEPATGSMTFTTSGGEASTTHPATATAGHPAEITLSQQCSYNDVNGSTYRCEPKAVVRMTTEKDNIKAKTIAELTNIQQAIQQSQTGTNPVTYQAKQTFTIGGQSVTFDLRARQGADHAAAVATGGAIRLVLYGRAADEGGHAGAESNYEFERC